MLCKNILLFVICMAMFVCVRAEAIDSETELDIIKGLFKRNLIERRSYVYKTYKTNSKAIFDKLARMYKVNNEIKEDVFYAMECMNRYSRGKFCKPLLEAMESEFLRLKKLKNKDHPEIGYLMNCFYIIIERPFSGFDNFIKSFYADCSKYLESSDNYDKYKEYFQSLCVYYFAKRNRRGYMTKLVNIYKKNITGYECEIVSLFTSHKDPRIYEAYTENILKENNFFLACEFENYSKYCKAINKKIPKKIKTIYDIYMKRIALEDDIFGDD